MHISKTLKEFFCGGKRNIFTKINNCRAKSKPKVGWGFTSSKAFDIIKRISPPA